MADGTRYTVTTVDPGTEVFEQAAAAKMQSMKAMTVAETKSDHSVTVESSLANIECTEG